MTVYNDLPKSTTPPDTVNVHFHGLEVSPNAPGDEVLMTLARPGQVLHYRVHIPLTQEPGLYWYHPHAMPETYWQVSYGMSGVIVVEGMQRHFPALAAMKERIIVLRDVPTIGGMFDDLDDVTPAQTIAAPTARRSRVRPAVRRRTCNRRLIAKAGPSSASPRESGSSFAWSTHLLRGTST